LTEHTERLSLGEPASALADFGTGIPGGRQVDDLIDRALENRSSRISAERFVEEIGLVFDSMHLPRMAGRVLGAILLGPADGATAGDLAETLQASKGSISNMTQLLIHYRFVERTVRAGDRRDRFVIKSGAWARMMLWRLELLQRLRELAGDGLELLGPEGNPEPLQEVRDMYAFLERELPKLFDRWEVERATLRVSARKEAS
jgi:DNA-binding transcriptional regulator GbsR (MarR family)